MPSPAQGDAVAHRFFVFALLLFSGESAALYNDKVIPSVSVSRSWDDNVYRLSSSADPQLAIGSSQRGDAFTTTNLGLAFDVPWARQRFQASAQLTKNAYDLFTARDYVGNSARANWLWQLGNKWSGQAGATTSDTLGSTANFQGTTPNPITASSAFLSASWQLHPDWRLGAGLNANQQRNGASSQKINDTNSTVTDMAITYLTGAGNTIGFNTRVEQARFPTQQVVSGAAVDNAYDQTSYGMAGSWRYSANSNFNAGLDHVSRDYKQLASRKYEGRVWRLGYNWTPAGRSSLSASVFRDVNQTEELKTNLIVATGVSLRMSLSLTGKMNLSGTLDRGTKDYLGDAQQVIGSTATRHDVNHTGGLSLAYQISRRGSISLGVVRDNRTSTFAGYDYQATTVNIGGQISF
ncbi:MAG: XrtB/PEP-CTERM-associated polysaccharide biosynthesis outer membrane protein EpsL [Betaproteobacteria bacterium]